MKQLTKMILLAALLTFVQGATAQEMKIISFNIRYNSWDNIDGENGWPNRKEAVAKMINEEQPVAIGLQEALIDQLLYLDSMLVGYKRVGVGRDDGIIKGEFMAIYYDTMRIKMLAVSTKWLSETPRKPSLGWDAACRRTVTVAYMEELQSGKRFCYMNTHLDHVGKMARDEGARMIAEMAPEGQPVIIGGDMNSTIDDPIFKHFYEFGFKAAREVTSITSHKNTYTGFGKDKPSMIDHFLIRDFEVESFRTLDGDYGVPYISDHYPIEIVIRL